MLQLHESGSRHVTAPGVQIVVSAVTAAIPAFLVVPPGIRAEQHAARLEGGVQLSQHAWQFLCGHVKQRGIRENAIEVLGRQIKSEKILLPHFAAGLGARHRSKGGGALQADGNMAHPGKGGEVTARSTAKIENRKGRRKLDMAQ